MFPLAKDDDWFFRLFVEKLVDASAGPAILDAIEEDRRLELAMAVM